MNEYCVLEVGVEVKYYSIGQRIDTQFDIKVQSVTSTTQGMWDVRNPERRISDILPCQTFQSQEHSVIQAKSILLDTFFKVGCALRRLTPAVVASIVHKSNFTWKLEYKIMTGDSSMFQCTHNNGHKTIKYKGCSGVFEDSLHLSHDF